MADQKLSLIIEAVDQATKTLNKIEKETKGLSVVSAAAFVSMSQTALTAAKAVVDFGLAGVKAADAMFDMSQRTGISTETLSAFKLEADKSGTSIETLENGFKIFGRTLLDAKEGNEAAIFQLRELGITATDANGHLQTMESLLPQLADKFAGMKNATEKAALAQQIFGRAGADLVPFLSNGSKGLADMRKRADELGITLSTSAADAANKFSDQMVEAEAQIGAFSRRVGGVLIPTLGETISWWTKAEKAIRDYFTTLERSDSETIRARIHQDELSGTLGGFKKIADDANNILGTQIAKLRILNPENQKLDGIIKSLTSSTKEVGVARANTLAGLIEQTEREIALEQEKVDAKKAILAEEEATLIVDAATKKKREEELKAAHKDRVETMIKLQEEARVAVATSGLAGLDELRARQDIELQLLREKFTVAGQITVEGEDAISAKLAANRVARAKLELDIQKQKADKILGLSDALTTAMLSSEETRNQALKDALTKAAREELKQLIQVKSKELIVTQLTEVGKAAAMGPLSFGLSLLAIAPIVAATVAAQAALEGMSFAKGGMVTGGTPGRDSVPAMLMPGEAVLPKSLVDAVLERGGPGASSAGIVFNGDVEIFGNRRYIELVAEELSKLVQFQGGTLIASRTNT